ncbi:hypothetical protein J6590_051467 [Homalodisca vitripennis]|nr:hypothetical protein J6590_051467 [Homalodisca vitripennis]
MNIKSSAKTFPTAKSSLIFGCPLEIRTRASCARGSDLHLTYHEVPVAHGPAHVTTSKLHHHLAATSGHGNSDLNCY